MSSLAWMPIYTGDVLAETASLSTDEFGAYILLLFAYWQAGDLPQDDVRLARIARLDLERWQSARPSIESLFGPGWTNAGLDGLRNNAADKRERKIAAGRKGAASRWGNGKGNAVANGTRIGSANGKGNAEPIATSTITSSPAYEGKTLTHAYTHAREAIPLVKTELDAGQWLSDQGLFPGDECFGHCIDKMLRGELDWSDIDEITA
ncbi:DUF1376 domain-containing protein [Mesorhizobium delmotii]|uniref:DUF1376 domain-containing protein n=1 Tax=Mesorhizobium delmotii TaxID=1631247 RepID=UPI000F43D7F4|nr:DUF1376 domain-containing protein [Mesorhizobium delmotii]